MKKSLIKPFLLSVALLLLLVPVGAIGHHIKFSASCILYAVLTLYLLRSRSTSSTLTIIAVLTPIALINGLVHSLNFVGTLLSLPSSIAPFFGVALGMLINQGGKLKVTLSIILLLSISIVGQTYGYTAWLRFLNFGTFTDVVSYKIPKLLFVGKDGNTISSEDFKNATVVLDFWNTACGACFQKFPVLQGLSDEYSETANVRVYAINVPIDRDSVTSSFEALERRKYTFTNLVSKDSAVLSALEIEYYPTTFIIQNGVVVYKGEIDNVRSFIQNQINR